MSKAYEFLKECGSFFVLTLNGDYPAGRPFGAAMEVGDYLYLATNDMNSAHKQMREHNKIQIVAKKPDSREWIRITGIATECDDKDLNPGIFHNVFYNVQVPQTGSQIRQPKSIRLVVNTGRILN